MPFNSTNGTLRCYYSTKAGHEDDEKYRLKMVTNIFSDKIEYVSNINEIDVINCLVQCVFERVDGIETRVVNIVDGVDVREQQFEHDKAITKRKAEMCFEEYKKNGVPIKSKTDEYLSYNDMLTFYKSEISVKTFISRIHFGSSSMVHEMGGVSKP